VVTTQVVHQRGLRIDATCGFVATADVEDIVLVDGVRLACLAMTKRIA
jgi:hypothetical protein